jgi:hypothetical protein
VPPPDTDTAVDVDGGASRGSALAAFGLIGGIASLAAMRLLRRRRDTA